MSTDPEFTKATIWALHTVDDRPLATADSSTNPHLRRFLFSDGRLLNVETNTKFLEELGSPKAFFALVSDNPRTMAEEMAWAYRERGYKARVVGHYDQEMKGKMFFVSFRDSKYNPGWVPAFRLHGRKLGPTKRWHE